MNTNQAPRLLSVAEASAVLGVGRTQVFALLNGQLESVKIGARRLVPADALDAYVAKLRTDQAGDPGEQ